MRQVAEKIGAPVATVSQTEKGQRALKEPKIGVWAAALKVGEAELHELWVLSQGLVPAGDRLVFYADPSNPLAAAFLGAETLRALRERPDLEPIYRLAERIADVLGRLLPYGKFQVEPDDIGRFKEERGLTGRALANEAEEYAAVIAAFVPIPFINYYEDGWSGPSYGVGVPLLEKPTRVVRRRGKSVNTVELEDLIRDLSGPERERVRGYVEAIVEQRAHSED
ncbi:hypothetical protein [Micromonospora sp. NPDC051006]|uniref:hypothetical protein n=1 Tax=Micromonospora sp. NPDC051006 TaxID=3364283 RepID=UPI0037974D79